MTSVRCCPLSPATVIFLIVVFGSFGDISMVTYKKTDKDNFCFKTGSLSFKVRSKLECSVRCKKSSCLSFAYNKSFKMCIVNHVDDDLCKQTTDDMVLYTDSDNCRSNPCLNNGTCVKGVNTYICICAACFTGAACQTGSNTDCTNKTTNGILISSYDVIKTVKLASDQAFSWIRDSHHLVSTVWYFDTSDKPALIEQASVTNQSFSTKTIEPDSQGTGYVRYGDHLYGNKHDTAIILKWKIYPNLVQVASIDLETGDSYIEKSNNKCYYTEIDLDQDMARTYDFDGNSHGIWVMYARNLGNDCRLSIALLSHDLSTVVQRWYTLWDKTTMGDGFIIDTTFYGLASPTLENSYIKYIYNTSNSTGRVLSPTEMPFTNYKGTDWSAAATSQLSYNDIEGKIFAASGNRHDHTGVLLTYNVTKCT